MAWYRDFTVEVKLNLQAMHHVPNIMKHFDLANNKDIKIFKSGSDFKLRAPIEKYNKLVKDIIKRKTNVSPILMRCRENEEEVRSLLGGHYWGIYGRSAVSHMHISMSLPYYSFVSFMSYNMSDIVEKIQSCRCFMDVRGIEGDNKVVFYITGPRDTLKTLNEFLVEREKEFSEKFCVSPIQTEIANKPLFLDAVLERMQPIAVVMEGDLVQLVFPKTEYPDIDSIIDMLLIIQSELVDVACLERLHNALEKLSQTERNWKTSSNTKLLPKRRRANSLSRLDGKSHHEVVLNRDLKCLDIAQSTSVKHDVEAPQIQKKSAIDSDQKQENIHHTPNHGNAVNKEAAMSDSNEHTKESMHPIDGNQSKEHSNRKTESEIHDIDREHTKENTQSCIDEGAHKYYSAHPDKFPLISRGATCFSIEKDESYVLCMESPNSSLTDENSVASTFVKKSVDIESEPKEPSPKLSTKDSHSVKLRSPSDSFFLKASVEENAGFLESCTQTHTASVSRIGYSHMNSGIVVIFCVSEMKDIEADSMVKVVRIGREETGLVGAAATDVIEQCKRILETSDKTLPNILVMSDPQKASKTVLLTMVPDWGDSDESCVEILEYVLSSCLYKAEELKLTSIALPTLGLVDFPREQITKSVCLVITKFCQKYSVKAPYLKNIFIVDEHEISAFRKAMSVYERNGIFDKF